MVKFSNFIDRCRFFYVSLVLAAIIFLAYFPSLGHVFRADQLPYMADMGQRPQTFQSLVLNSYDYDRDRRFLKGDQQLFRPLFFSLLGLEYFVFGTDPLGWQLTGIILHILLTLTIFRFMWLVVDRSLAFVCALYFGVLPTTMEMVVWQHINFYMLFLIFFYLGIIGLLGFKKRHDIKSVLLIAAALTGAALTYELGCVVSFILAVYIFWITPQNIFRRFLNTGIVLMPIVIYGAWDSWSLMVHHLHRADLAIPGIFLFVTTLKNFIFVHLKCLEWIFFPPQFGIELNYRFVMSTFNGFNPAAVFSVVLLYFYARSMSFKSVRKGFELRNIFIASLVIYALVLTVGRINPRGQRFLPHEVHYVYMYAALALPLIAGFIDIQKLKNLTVHCWQKGLLFIAIVGSIGYCFIYTLNKNIEAKRDFAAEHGLLTFVNQFIGQHKNEPNFSFSVAYDAKGNYFIIWLINDAEKTNYTFAQAVYVPYYKSYNWKYRIFYDTNENMYRVQRKNWLL